VHYNSRNDFGNLELLDDETKEQIEIVSGDIRDPFFILRATKDIDAIFHLAALIPIPYSYVAPQSFFETNVQGTMNLLEAVRFNNIERIAVTSTSETYGTAQYTPIDEKHPSQGQSPYSASKIGADKLAESYYLSFDLPVVTVRPFNTFGPRQSARAVIPTIISQALVRDKIKLGSLTAVRDFTYVKDTAEAFVAAVSSDKSIGQVINFGTGVGTEISKVKEEVEKIMGKKIEVETDEQRIRPKKSEVWELICDSTKAKDLTGWQPVRSLNEGLAETVEFIANHPEIYKPDIYNI